MAQKTAGNSFVRWPAIVLLVGLLLSVSVLRHPAQAAPSGQRLRVLAGSFLIGYSSTDDFWAFPDTATYQATARSEFNILTPENELKWARIHPERDTYNFALADRHIQFAQDKGMLVHGHTLVWHGADPGWLTSTSWTSSTLTSVLEDHIDTVVGHYRGRIALWDVVNEAFEDDGSFRQSFWFEHLGSRYLELAFRRAHSADPSALLLYNDYGIETLNGKSDAVFELVQDFQRRGVPIDGIGMQMHLDSNGLDYTSFASNMQRFANLGVQIYITEMDVRLAMPPSASALQNQATIYGSILDRCLLQPTCKGFQMWGFTDKYSWIPDYCDFCAGQGAPLIFDTTYAAKPAYFALQSHLGATPRFGKLYLPFISR